MFNNFNPKTDVAVGIDLGTTNSAIAVWSDELKRAKVIKVDENQKTIPSVVAFKKTSTSWVPIIGRKAEKIRVETPTTTVHNVKRLIGQESVDSESVQQLLAIGGASFSVLPSSCKGRMVEEDSKYPSKIVIQISKDGSLKTLFPEQLSSLILSHVKTKCELFFDDKKRAKFAVISVPAHFTHTQRLATMEAAFQAGFVDVKLISEPTAAALAYGLGMTGTKKVFVFDLGGGTFDTSVLNIDDGNIEVICTLGDNNLGGNNIDDAVVKYCLGKLLLMSNSTSNKDTNLLDTIELCSAIGISRDSASFATIKQACIVAKKDLSRNEKTFIYLKKEIEDTLSFKIVGTAQNKGKSIRIPFSRKQLNSLTEPIVDKCIKIATSALHDATLEPENIDEIVLVGGCTRMPLIREKVQTMFPGKILCTSINPDQVVAEGAAIRAAMISGVDHEMLRDVLMMDVLPSSIGIEAANGDFVPLLKRLSKIPCKATKLFRTFEDNQPGVTVRIFEGEDECAENNHKMGEFNFFIPYADRGKGGEVAVEVTFCMTEGGIIQVTSNYDGHNAGQGGFEDTVRFLCLLVVLLGLVSGFVYLRLNPLLSRKEDFNIGL